MWIQIRIKILVMTNQIKEPKVCHRHAILGPLVAHKTSDPQTESFLRGLRMSPGGHSLRQWGEPRIKALYPNVVNQDTSNLSVFPNETLYSEGKAE